MNFIIFNLISLLGLNFATSRYTYRSDVHYPCRLENTDCIRRYLSRNSLCSQRNIDEPPRDPTVLSFLYETPYFNATTIDHYAIGSNFQDCKVSALFLNRTSQVTVMALDCPDLKLEVYRRIILHKPGQEDVYIHYKATAAYGLITVTVNLENPHFLDICKVVAHAYIYNFPKTQAEATDEISKEFLEKDPTGMLTTHHGIWLRELFIYRATPIFQAYVNSYLCDFGCAVY